MLEWESKLEPARDIVYMLGRYVASLDPNTYEYKRYLNIYKKTSNSLTLAYSTLAIQKAKYGIVGKEFYEPD